MYGASGLVLMLYVEAKRVPVSARELLQLKWRYPRATAVLSLSVAAHAWLTHDTTIGATSDQQILQLKRRLCDADASATAFRSALSRGPEKAIVRAASTI